MTQQRKRCGKGGFTLVELVVTLVILSILFAIAVPSLLGYIHLSQFRKNESYAKTMYLSAESELTYLRTGGEWESFCSKVKKEGVLNQSFDESDEDRKKLVGRIYGIRLDAGEYAEGELSGDGALVGALLSQDTYDKSVLNAAICIEIDVESGQVYSVFYGTNCKGLYYGSNEDSKPADMSGSWLDIDYSKRDRDTRQKERLGYYSVQDAVNAVSLDATKLKITSINLVNGETLSLNWSSNVKDQDLDKVYYEVKLYSSEDKAQLLSINIPGRNLKTGSQSVAVTTEDNATKDYTFPVEYDRTNKRATLVLDGMMNAKLYDQLDKLSADNAAAFRQSSDTSITRFGGKLENPLNVYAAVQVFPDPNAENTGGEEYQKSDAIESNKANTLFGDGTRSNNSRCEIETFRHLSNIRYMDTAAAFAVTARSLDWTSDSVKVYGTAARGALSVSAGKDIGFPSIPALRSNQTLDGTGGLLNRIVSVITGGNTISNLKLDEDSVASGSEYLGLFQQNEGSIINLKLANPSVKVTSDSLKGVGAVCGFSSGSLKDSEVTGAAVDVNLAGSTNAQGIGGVAGVIEVSDSKSVIKLSASGTVTGTLPTGDTARGIGGIAGSLTTNGAAVKTLTNSAAVTGNRSVGGIAGYFSGKDQATGKDMADCQNEGLILSSIAADDHSLAGHYIGGIVGYAHNASLSECRSRAGYADGYTYKQEDRDKLRGRYVGGIVGYGEQSVLYDCETEANGYVLGSEYVGGIIGALNQSDTQTALLSENGTRTTVNASYVIGNSYVGGIIGENKGGSTIKNCVNTGVAAGYNAYIGGICGANENKAAIINCASYVSDTNNAIYRRVTDWGAVGSYAGGLTGYNNGTITFSDKDNAVSNRSVAGIVVGRHYVGGLVGYNDTDGTIDINYTLIGGRVAATGDCVGGLVGLNASTELLEKKLTIKPSSVQGRYYVGGAIGANVVNPGENVTVSGLKVDNSLGTVTAEAFCGGLIGYQRTYTEQDRAGGTLYALLPGIAANNSNAPGTVKASTNRHTITITADGNSAGGVVGAQEGAKAVLRYAKNLGQVTANVGAAGGIVGMNSASSTVENCIGNGSITSNDGYAGGVASENYGTIRSCSVGTADNRVTLITRNKTAAGAICAVNYKGGTVQGAVLGDHITISGSAFILGAVVGDNSGTVTETEVSQQPTYSVSASTLQVGGAVGINRAGGTVSKVKVTSDFEKFTKYTYLGGVVGQNNASGKVTECTYSGTIDEGKSAVGNCYGGIAGLNGGLLQGSTVSGLTLTADGVYTATSTSSAAEKERLSSHIGGIAGKNDTTGIIEQCYIDNTGTGTITVKNGMVGGVTGYNKGTITMSGDKSTEALMENVSKVSELLANAKAQKLSADSTWVKWENRTDVEKLSYNGGSKSVAADRTMQIIVSSNGNLGGVAGYNAPTGELNRCVSGSWLLVNKSDGIGVGTGGIVGMNESEKDLSFLLNRAFVGRQLKQQNTSRFAGGIIGTQSNKTTSDWTIENCINYGTVYGYLSHYSGGIVGQWTNNGGTVEDCYNYGNLQTTYAASWVGASGGIVAQLYHAASGQDFNILSCQNHGSIYGRWGNNTSYSANDSAGILGNITAYTASSAAMGQQFNINVVDCLNAPGVKIYSGSMASGIVGFFSVDNATSNNGASITASTANIVLNIDRCRNYAYTDDLVGTNFRAGIFGDRYGSAATQNTYIQNCYSVPIRSDNGIISFQTGRSTRLDVNRVGNNYYFFDTWGLTERGNTAGITYKTDEARNNGAGESRRGYARMAAYGEFDGKFYAAIVGPRLDPTLNLTQNEDARTKCGIYYNMTDSNTRVENGILISKFNDGTEKITGRILFEMPPDYSYDQVRTWHANNLMPAISQKTGKLNNLSGGKIMDDYVREAYRTMEHGQNSKKLDTSFTVDLKQQTDGSFDVSIEDTDRPLYYEGTVLVDGKEVLSNLRFIPNQKGQGQWDPKLNGTQAYGSGMTTGTFQLPASLAADTAGKTITLSVRAVSLFEDTAPSAWKTAATQNVSVLPTPDVNIRLVSHWNNGAKYQISLKNLADYAVFSNWKVTFRLGSQTVTIDQNNHTAEISGDDLKELIVTAAAGITNGIQPATVTDTIPTDTPKYKPDGSINQLSVSYSGSTVDDCTVTAALTVNEPQMETPPIYRIEVLGTVGTNEYVFAYEDVLTSAGNTVTANFRDLPKEYFAENVTNRRVRAWYAASGLGPVYTYGDTRQADDASATLRTYSAEGVQQQDKTIYSHVLGHANDFANYIRTAALNIKPLTAPELNDPVLIPEDNGSISYRFSWTQSGQGTAAPHYSVKLTGITAAGARIGIPVNEVYGTQENPNTSQSFTINADDWQYAEVELTVTRLGQEYGEVGLSTTKKYAVKQRLERPGQPLVINPDTNELEYTIGWSAIGSENGCAGYQIYVQPEGETAAALGELVPVRGGTCSVSRSLEDYAGKTIDLYLVAVAADDSGYADSPNGIVYTMTVPMRLNTPSVKWSYNWNATANNPIPAAGFRSGGLQVTVTPENEASVPPGGSTYLLRAKITGPDGTTVTYPVSAMSESGGSYVCSLTDLDTKYAGCSVRFEARISQSAGQVSSVWVSSGDVVFPRVKLEAPSASLANVNETLAVSYGPMNRLINTAEWDAQLTALSWDEVAEADLYRIELTDKDDKSTTVTVDMSGNLPEIIINGQNTFAVAGDDWYTVKQGSAVNGRYSLTNGSIRYYSYQPDTMLQVKDGTFTLKLPNIFSVVTHENQTLQLTNGIQISRVTVIADSKSDRYTESDPAERRF